VNNFDGLLPFLTSPAPYSAVTEGEAKEYLGEKQVVSPLRLYGV